MIFSECEAYYFLVMSRVDVGENGHGKEVKIEGLQKEKVKVLCGKIFRN